MSENIKSLGKHHLISMNTSLDANIRMPANEDDEFLEFYTPSNDHEHDETKNHIIKKLISPLREDAFTEEVLYEVVNNRLGFVLPYHLWEEINEAFTYYWNEEIGLNGDLFEGTMYIAIREYLTKDLFFCPDELLQEIVTAIEEFIVTIPGVVIQD